MSGDLIKEYQDMIDTTALVFKMDIYGKITYINNKFSKITKFDDNDIENLSFETIKDNTFSNTMYEEMWSTILSKESWHGIIRNVDKNKNQFYLRATFYPILDIEDKIKDIMCISYEISQEIQQEKDKNKKIISTKTNFVQKTKDKEASIQKELNDAKSQLEKALDVIEYLKTQNTELIKKSEAISYESEINRLVQENDELRKSYKKSENTLKSLQLEMIRKEKSLNEKANNLYIKTVDLTSRNENLNNEVKKYKSDLQKLSTMINNSRKPVSISNTIKSDTALPTYKDKDKNEKMKGSVLKAMFE